MSGPARTRPTRRLRAIAPLAAAVLAAAGCGAGAAPAFGPALTVVEAGASRPTSAVDPRSGAVYIAWVGTEQGVAGVYVARMEPGAARPGAPVRVNDVPGDAAPHEQAPARVVVGPEGNVYVAWQNSTRIEGRRFPASDLRFARSVDGGRSFEPALTINDDAGGLPSSHTFHDMAVGADGTLFVSWIDSRERERRRAALAAAGGAGGHGHGEEGLPGPEIRLARSTDGGRSFEPSRVVDVESCPCCRTSLATGPEGTVYVAWRKVFDGSVRDIVVARSEDGGATFAAPVRVHADQWTFDACPHAGPVLAVDGRGRLHVGWYTGREGRQGIYYAVSEDRARSFGPPVPVLVDAWVPPSQVALAVDEVDGVWIAWDDRREEERRVQVARVRDGGAAVGSASAALPGFAPALDLVGRQPVLAWQEQGALRVRFGL